MDYSRIMAVLNANGIEKLVFNSETLRILIENDMKEYYSFFPREAFTIENISMIIEKSSYDTELSIIPLIRRQGSEIIPLLIKKKYFNFLLDNYTSLINNYDENINNLIFDNLGNEMISPLVLKRAIRNDNKELIINKIIEIKRFDLIASLLMQDIKIDEKQAALIGNDTKEVIDFLDLFDGNLNSSMYTGNYTLFKNMFLNGKYDAIKIFDYYSNSDIKAKALEDREIIDKIIEYSKVVKDEEFLKTIIQFEIIKRNSLVLNNLLKNNIYDYYILNCFQKEAWNLENQMIYAKVCREKNINPVDTKEGSLVRYYCNYKFGQDYVRDINISFDINNINNFKDFELCMIIGKKIVNGEIKEDSNIAKLYKLVYETKSFNVCRLINALLDENIGNINKLVDGNGFTDYFKDYLLYDFDYIRSDVHEEINDENYKLFTILVRTSNNSNLLRAIYDIGIYKDNLRDYISNGLVTRKLIDKCFNDKNIDLILYLHKTKLKLDLTDIESALLSKIDEIEDDNQKKIFLNYYMDNKDEIDFKDIDAIYILFVKVNESNSYEMHARSVSIIKSLLRHSDYLERFDKLERIFTDGSAPEFIKRFAMYKLLYGDRDIREDNNVASPILKSVSREEADEIILSDLFKVSLATNSKDIETYLAIIIKGEEIYKKIDPSKKELSPMERRFLHEYRIRLEFICDFVRQIEYEKSEDDYETISSIEKALTKNYHQPVNFHLFSIVDQLLSGSKYSKMGSIRAAQIYMKSRSIIKDIYEEGKTVRGEKLEIKSGDFLKGIDSIFLDNIMSNGSLSIEFLGEGANEDFTHLDTDMSLIQKDFSSIPELLKERYTACHYDMKLLISMDYIRMFNDFIISKDETGVKPFSEEDHFKTEILCTGGSNYGIRTGFPLTFVKAIIASRNIDRAKLLIIRNDFYIPLYDEQGNLLLSYDEYVEAQSMKDGLSFFDQGDKYTISENLLVPGIEEVMGTSEENEKDIAEKQNRIYEELDKIFSKYFGKSNYSISRSVNKNEIDLIDTGSTGRGTNVMGDCDFDFIVRVDQEFLSGEKQKKFAEDIYKAFNQPVGEDKRIRLKNVHLDGIDNPLKIELTIISKNARMDYTTDMCVKDRLDNIKKLYPDKYDLVVANIIYAKQFLKGLERYAPFQGGFGGVGVENWILQNGGSFYDAAKSFLETAKKSKNFEEFKENYPLYDFGKNFYYKEPDNYKTVSFPYDNFISILKPDAYTEIVKGLDEYFKNLERAKAL